MIIKWKIGCSGFSYREWKGIFYPESIPQTKWFEYYASQFSTLELNVTFYRFPRLNILLKWYETSPAEFLFTVKAPRLITHFKKFVDCSRLLDDFYGTISDGLKEKLGPVLFQLPPKYAYETNKLNNIIRSLDKRFKNVLEFRDTSWWRSEVIETLKQHNVIFCGIDYPALPNDVVTTSNVAYYRFHGKPRLYHSAYTKNQLKKIADSIGANTALTEAYVFFNNTASFAAIKNANWLKQYIEAQKS